MTVTKAMVWTIIFETFGDTNKLASVTDCETALWRDVFHKVFGSLPNSDDDARWTELFDADGYAALMARSTCNELTVR
jgi:hypothetical protein